MISRVRASATRKRARALSKQRRFAARIAVRGKGDSRTIARRGDGDDDAEFGETALLCGGLVVSPIREIRHPTHQTPFLCRVVHLFNG